MNPLAIFAVVVLSIDALYALHLIFTDTAERNRQLGFLFLIVVVGGAIVVCESEYQSQHQPTQVEFNK